MQIRSGILSEGEDYSEDELEELLESLEGVPVVKDPNNKVDSVVGVVKDAEIEDEAIVATAEIADREIVDRLQDETITLTPTIVKGEDELRFHELFCSPHPQDCVPGLMR